MDAGMDARQAGGLLSQQAGKPVPSVPAMERLRAMCSILGACLLAMTAQEPDVDVRLRIISHGSCSCFRVCLFASKARLMHCQGQWQYQADLLGPFLCPISLLAVISFQWMAKPSSRVCACIYTLALKKRVLPASFGACSAREHAALPGQEIL